MGVVILKFRVLQRVVVAFVVFRRNSMSRRIANLLFLLATIGWGSSYLFTKFAVNELEPFTLVAIRFGLAFCISFAIFYRKLIHVCKQTIGASMILGVLMCAMFAMFNIVLKTENPSTVGFLLSTTVIFVPIFTVFMTRKLPPYSIVIGGLITTSGLTLFMFEGGMTMDMGVLLSILTAMMFALHLVVNNYFAQKYDALQLGVYQLGFASLFGIVCMMSFESMTGPQSSLGWISIFVLAVICSAFGFVVQSVAQKYTSAVETGFILALEPVFSALFAYIVLGEELKGREWLGALIIFSGVLIASYQRKEKATIHSPAQDTLKTNR
jgi:drug/metabolite transporter (DMT)-like permease